VECFASPLNSYLPAFGSAFADVDAAFGSRGSFFKFRPNAGSYCANPPFVHSVMDDTASHILTLLTAAAAAPGGPALSFALILPGWGDGGGFQALSASPFLRAKVVIAAPDHGFCDGASHQRQDPYRHSPFDTAIFVLQTDKASRKWPASHPSWEGALRKAFGSCVPSEAAVARQAKKSGGAAHPRGSAEGQARGNADRKSRKRAASEEAGDEAEGAKPAKKGAKQGSKHDKATEKKLNVWVKAKRTKDWETADRLREELRAAGIQPEVERPARGSSMARADKQGE